MPTIKEELYNKWKTVMATCVWRGKKNEGCPLDEKWRSFEGFYEDNYQRFRRAKNKWKNYQRITAENPNCKYKLGLVHIVRKVKERGFTKKNTCFTSVSDCMKFFKPSKKIILGNRVLGTRDVKNLLKKRGVTRSMGSIVTLMNTNKSIFKTNRLDSIKWNGENCSLKDIAKKENILYTVLKNRISIDKMSIEKAVESAKKYKQPFYMFEGSKLYPHEIINILAERHNLPKITVQSRFYKFGLDNMDIIINGSKSLHAPYKKKVIAERNGKKQTFESIAAACKKLGISSSHASLVFNGKKQTAKGYRLYAA